MLLEPFAAQERPAQGGHQLPLRHRQGIGIRRVEGGEMAVVERVGDPADGHRPFVAVHIP